MNFLVSIILGLVPEVLYFTLFITYTKNIKTRKLILFSLLGIGYIVLIMLCRYQFLFYVSYIVYSYLVLKLLYKSHISDIFMCSIGLMYMTIVAFVGYKLLGFNYVLYYIIARIVLYIPFIFRNEFNVQYKKYKSLWNRNDKNKIKSITIRNISLMILNALIIVLNIFIMLCTMDALKY